MESELISEEDRGVKHLLVEGGFNGSTWDFGNQTGIQQTISIGKWVLLYIFSWNPDTETRTTKKYLQYLRKTFSVIYSN